MIELNKGFSLLEGDYTFKKIADRKRNFRDLIDLSIGDVSYPLTKTVLTAYEKAVKEYGDEEMFRGYAPSSGYDFLKNAIVDYYAAYNAEIYNDEIFISDGSKGEIYKLLNLFSPSSTVAIFSPYYPAFYDCAVLSNKQTEIIDTTEDFFKPSPKRLKKKSYVIILCSPSNPCGITLNKSEISEWIDFALETKSIILFDSAYSSFIRDETPVTPYSVDGSKNCVIEISSFSKGFSFTGIRCGFVVVPDGVTICGEKLKDKYRRMNDVISNGVNYAVQRAAEAALSVDGRKENRKIVDLYLDNAKRACEVLNDKKIAYYGGKNSSYIFLKCPHGYSSDDFFEDLLNRLKIVVTPGNGFGLSGEGYARISCLKNTSEFSEALKRLQKARL